MQKTLKWKVAQQVELFWWKRYLKKKHKEEYLSWKKSYWKKVIAYLDEKPAAGERVLDAGCGPAGVFLILQDQYVDAVDPLLENYKKTLDLFNVAEYPYTTFHALPLEEFNSVPYKWVFCLNAINHVSDIEKSLEKLSTLTKTDGILALSIDAHNFNSIKKLFRLIPGDVLHPHQYNLKEYKEMLQEKGFTISKIILLKHEFIFDHYLIIAKNA